MVLAMKLDTKQVAALLGVSPSTVQVWRHRGYGPKFTYSKARVVYSERTVRAFLKRMKKQTLADACKARKVLPAAVMASLVDTQSVFDDFSMEPADREMDAAGG